MSLEHDDPTEEILDAQNYKHVFTDDELKSLKESSQIHIDCEDISQCLVRPMTAKECMALLARLEAAETKADTLWKCNVVRCEPWPCIEAKDKDEAWRKACGR